MLKSPLLAWKVTCLCSGGCISAISSPLAAAAAAAGGRVSTSSIAASLFSLSIMAPPPVVRYDILQRGGSGGARQQPTGSKDAPCPRHAPAPWQIEAISTMTYKHNQTCYIYIFNWCVCSEGRVKGPLAVLLSSFSFLPFSFLRHARDSLASIHDVSTVRARPLRSKLIRFGAHSPRADGKTEQRLLRGGGFLAQAQGWRNPPTRPHRVLPGIRMYVLSPRV